MRNVKNISNKLHIILIIIQRIISDPSKILKISEWKRLFQLTQYVSYINKTAKWTNEGLDEKFKRRDYQRYEDYIKHQKSKLTIKGKEYLTNYDKSFYSDLLQRLKGLDTKVHFKEKNVLCLAARIGTEVRPFIDMGGFAIGIDLNPGSENKYVLYGDFHNIQFSSSSIDIIYTNSFDHVFDKDKIIQEIIRLLKNDGYLILELGISNANEEGFSTYESFFWKNIDDVNQLFIDKGFKTISSTDFESPWVGKSILYKIIK
jgi:SAM-dependent methyltransferase